VRHLASHVFRRSENSVEKELQIPKSTNSTPFSPIVLLKIGYRTTTAEKKNMAD
jgi:hypothetical protein